MAYTIAVEDKKTAVGVVRALTNKCEVDGRFVIQQMETTATEVLSVRAKKNGAKPRQLVVLHRIRLTKNKPYCGQHPGECVIGIIGILGARPKPALRCLEWGDWVRFNELINDVLDKMGACAEVWSRPRELPIRGQSSNKFWIRKENRRRRRWDWESEWNGMREIRRWDMGSESQFILEP